MDSRRDDTVLPVPGFPIRKSPDQSLLSGSPKLIAASHVLHRLLAPRHPPCALNSLTSNARALMRLHSPVTRTFTIQLSKSSDTSSVDDVSYRACWISNGADGHRTHDPRLAKPVLSQLSYSPTMGLGRVELPTSPLSGVRSSQLSYRPTTRRCCSSRGSNASVP